MSHIPVILMRERRAEKAWEVHRALMMAEQREPELAANSKWRSIRKKVFADFEAAFKELK